MNRRAEEEVTGRIRCVRKRFDRVTRDEVRGERAAGLAGVHGVTQAEKVRVIAPVQPDEELDAGLLYRGKRDVGTIERPLQRLLAENVLSRRGRRLDDPGVGLGRRTDDHRGKARVRQQLGVARVSVVGPVCRGAGFRLLAVGVGDGGETGTGDAGREVRGVDLTDRSGADHADAQVSHQRPSLARYSRSARALSSGQPSPGGSSSSTTTQPP